MTKPQTFCMTNAESIVVSLEWAKKLKEAGWQQEESFFLWHFTDEYTKGSSMEWVVVDPKEWDFREHNMDGTNIENFPAPTAEEILRRLPSHVDDDRMVVLRMGDRYGIYYLHHEAEYTDERRYYQLGDTLANAAAKMWIYLKSNNIL